MSYSLEAFFNFPDKSNLSNRVAEELGVVVSKTSEYTGAYSAEFRLASNQFWISENDLELEYITNTKYCFRLCAEIPSEQELDEFCLVFSTCIKSLTSDLMVDKVLICYSTQLALLELQVEDSKILDLLGDVPFSYVDLPKVIVERLRLL